MAFLKDRNFSMAGRKLEFIAADTGGNPAGALTKAKELIELDHILGPLAAYELLGISDYVAAHKTPMMNLAAADNITQHKLYPYFVRASATSSQAMHPMGHFAGTEMKLKRVTTLVEGFAFGYEQMGGFQEVFEKCGERVVKKLWAQ
jgi:branched-chain amino acid transport system substrate-binding protein